VVEQGRKVVVPGPRVDQPRGNSKMAVNDVDRALSEILAGQQVSVPVTNPIGCNIKWEGRERHWMPDDACDLV